MPLTTLPRSRGWRRRRLRGCEKETTLENKFYILSGYISTKNRVIARKFAFSFCCELMFFVQRHRKTSIFAAQNQTKNMDTQSIELIRTSQSWDGAELPDYLQGRPELVVKKYIFPVGQKLDWHYHPVMNYGVLVEGELTIIAQDGTEKVVHAGEAVVEMVGTVHHGENRGTQPAVLYMFYLSQEGLPLSVPCTVKEQ